MKKVLLIISLLFTTLSICKAQNTASNIDNVRIRIFSDKQIEEVLFVPSFGQYYIETDKGEKIKVNKTAKVKIKDLDGSLEIKINDSTISKTSKINLIATGLKAFFQIAPIKPQITERRYEDNLEITSKNNSLFIINVVKPDNYLAGVVQSETWGATTNIDFFKIQAICCRNYMMNNLEKHSNEGYNLCDGVHCQAYKTRANKKEVTEGAYKSKGEIIIDSEGNIIETLFHSNSGGTTVNAKDVWGKEVPYLVSVEDSFSVECKNYQWEKYIKLRDWLNYFKGKGLNIKSKEIEDALINFSQESGRKTEILGIPLTTVRKDFNLKSTYFNVQKWGGEVKLTGKGYGHGVGMSQEGAIKMCEEGYEYWEVIEHYFKGVKVIKQ
ncbi:MAG: SpoIID/LytB domain-containing protein [Bacteroidales bacterium]|nr:SpoIID/LytB domain-containing protein [Bacteroidales bacterium]